MRRLTTALLTLAALAGSTLLAAPAQAASSGVNDWTCRPDAAHASPVVLLHGMGSNKDQNWAFHGPALASAGYCVFSLTYGETWPGSGVGGLQHVDESAHDIRAFVDRVLASTGAAEVALVGHSEGGLQSLYVPKAFDYGSKVSHVVSIASPTHGTSLSGIVTLGRLLGGQALVNLFTESGQCFACTDMITGSDFITDFTDDPIAQHGVDYTVIATRYDTTATPPSTSFVPEPGVENYYVQDKCPWDPVGHVGIAVDPTITSMILNALDGRAIACGYGPPF